jgi:adenylate cyclase class IV
MADLDMKYLEIEHKYLVSADFDRAAFTEKLLARDPEKHYKTQVEDTYFLVRHAPQAIYRHRYDGMIQQLTVKSVASQDNEARLEVNLNLDLKENQSEAVGAFLQPLGLLWSGALSKSVEVFYFEDVEIVYYQARHGARDVACIEIEARKARSLEDGQKTLKLWAERISLNPDERCRQTLVQLLILPQLPDGLREQLVKLESSL